MSENGFLAKEKLTAICDSIRSKTGSTGLIHIDDIPQAIANIQTGGSSIIDVDKLVKGGWTGTPLVDEQYLENLYFNTNLSIDETVEILKNSTALETELSPGVHISGIVSPKEDESGNADDTKAYVKVRMETAVEGADIYLIGNYSCMAALGTGALTENDKILFCSSDVPNFGITAGWSTTVENPINFNSNIVIETSLAVDSSKFFSSTPFVQNEIKNDVFYRVKEGGVAVPINYVEKIYLNINLEPEKVYEILNKLNIEETSLIFVKNDYSFGLAIVKIEDTFAIGDMFQNIFYFAYGSLAQQYLGFSGWNVGFNGVVEVNGEGISELIEGDVVLPVGTHNNLLVEIISAKPVFGEGKNSIYSYDGEYRKVLQEGDINLKNDSSMEIVNIGLIEATSLEDTLVSRLNTIILTEEQYKKLESKNVIAKLNIELVEGSSFSKKEIYFYYNSQFHLKIYSESKQIYYKSFFGGDVADINNNVIQNPGSFIDTLVVQTDGTNYWATFTSQDFVDSTVINNYVRKDEINQYISDYITTNFENGDEGEY